MKYIKTYEKISNEDSWRSKVGPDNIVYDNTEEIFNKYLYKIGDYVKYSVRYGNEIFEITAIDLSDDLSPYRLCSLSDDNIGTWTHSRSLTRVPDYEVVAMKYNL